MNDAVFDRQTLSAIWQEHTYAEFVLKDVDRTMATMVEEPHVLLIPSGRGGIGGAEVRDFYARQFLPSIPGDFELIQVSQVFGGGRLVEEAVARFTHTLAMDWMLPGVLPTGRKVEFAIVVIVGIQNSKIAYEHILWDQAAVLSQLGLLPAQPVSRAGVASAARLLELSQGYGIC